METLKISIIKSDAQYNKYCRRVEELLESGSKSKIAADEIALLELLIEKYDDEHNTLDAEIDPVRLLKSFMEEAEMKAVDLAELLGVSKGLVSDILNYKKGLSKDIIRKLAERFNVRHDSFNRPYKLISQGTNRAGKAVVKRSRTKHKSYVSSTRKNTLVAAKEPSVKYPGSITKKKRK